MQELEARWKDKMEERERMLFSPKRNKYRRCQKIRVTVRGTFRSQSIPASIRQRSRHPGPMPCHANTTYLAPRQAVRR